MKNFQSFLFCLTIFTFALLSSHSLFAHQNFEKGDKVEIKLKVNNQEVWIAGTYFKFKKGKHLVDYTYDIDGWRGGGELQPFNDDAIRPFTGNITTTFKTETETAKKETESEEKKTPYEKGEKVEINIPVNGQDVWIEGTYMIFNKGEHRVSYQYDIDGWNGYGQLKPFDDEHIRPFTGDITTTFYADALQKSFAVGEKVEVLLTVNEKPVWVKGIYSQVYEGKHRVSYQYNIEGKKGNGNNMPFDDDHIRAIPEDDGLKTNE
ncbi:MAG: hypothetical protein R3E32_24160 [Chitinophagales bacterium]